MFNSHIDPSNPYGTEEDRFKESLIKVVRRSTNDPIEMDIIDSMIKNMKGMARDITDGMIIRTYNSSVNYKIKKISEKHSKANANKVHFKEIRDVDKVCKFMEEGYEIVAMTENDSAWSIFYRKR